MPPPQSDILRTLHTRVRRWTHARALWVALLVAGVAWPQVSEEEFRVYTEPPRLLLEGRRLRLLRRECERDSMRWRQFRSLVTGGAAMPEPGFAYSLYYRIAGDAGYGRKAVAWALGPATDLRQLALVFDWCRPVMSEAQAGALAAKLQQGLQQTAGAHDISSVRSRAFAAIGLADVLPDHGESVLRPLVEHWWRQEIIPALLACRNPIPRDQLYPLFELFHAVRANLNIELREGAPDFFKQLPIVHLMSYYPVPYQAPENDFRIPVSPDTGRASPDLRQAALSRAAALSMAAYDTNSLESQYLQGWLMHDQFLMRGAFGIPYEFLWANPYQPGLSFYHLPLFLHDSVSGSVFARSNWDDDATWAGYFDHQLQLFENGKLRTIDTSGPAKPVEVGPAVLVSGKMPLRFTIELQEPATLFVLGLDPKGRYDVEIDDEEMREQRADAAGVVEVEVNAPGRRGVRIRETGKPKARRSSQP